MRLSFGVSVPALILIGTFSAACDGGLSVEGNSAGPTRLRFASPAELGVQPESVRPTFGRDDSCQLSPPFSTTVSVIVTAAQDITIGGLGFEFTDTSGGRTTPTVMPGSSTA